MYYPQEQLQQMGFKSLGDNVKISDKTSLYGIERISIGNNVRIDDFCFLSAGEGGITLGNNIHISVYSSIAGKGAVIMEDFSGLSSRVSLYSSSDDYSGAAMTNPTVPAAFTNVINGTVHLKKHVIVGAGSVVLPGVVLEEGVAVGALSLVTKSFPEYSIIVGNPAKFFKNRKTDLKELEWKYLNNLL